MSSITEKMSIDILSVKDIWKLPKLTEIKCFNEYRSDPEDGIPVEAVVKYVVLLYSKDSILNKKPLEDLMERRLKAAKFADLDPTDNVTNLVFNLQGNKVRNLIAGYLEFQNSWAWSERIVLENQMLESQRLRLKPISMDEDDDTLNAFNKKNASTNYFSDWYKKLKEYDNEIFGSVSEDKDRIIRKRTTLESLV